MNNRPSSWTRDPGVRIEGSNGLDLSKVQAPCVVHNPEGGYRLFYTAVGPDRPYASCQGYILSAVSENGTQFVKEPGIRLCPIPEISHMSLRVLSPTVVLLSDGRWRMYIEARGAVNRPPVITSATSTDQITWEHETGIRLSTKDGVGGPRCVSRDNNVRLLVCSDEYGAQGRATGKRLHRNVISAVSTDGIYFVEEPGYCMTSRLGSVDDLDITAAQLVPPSQTGLPWSLIYSAWQDAPPGSEVPIHPSDPSATPNSTLQLDFASASIASDMAGYRSRIFRAHSDDGHTFDSSECILQGSGHHTDGVDSVHAEDMSIIDIGHERYRMYYAACDRYGCWRIASAVCEGHP